MSCLILKRKKEKANKLVTLSKTKKITDDDVEIHAKWSMLREWYCATESEEWVDKAITSVINSIVYQERIYFCLERDNVRNLISNDQNRESSIGLDNNNYKWLIQELVERDFIRLHDATKKPYIYKVIEPEILEMVKIDSPEDQLKQVEEFVGKNPKYQEVTVTDGSSDGKTDVDNKKEVNSKEETSEISSPSPSKKFTFEQICYREINKFKMSNEDLSMLAQIIIENCEVDDFGSFEKNIIKKIFKAMCGGKTSKKQNDEIDRMLVVFENEFKSFLVLKQTEDMEPKQPNNIQVKSAIQESKSEDAEQNRTLSVLKALFFKEEIQRINKKLKSDSLDENEKVELEHKLEYLERKIS